MLDEEYWQYVPSAPLPVFVGSLPLEFPVYRSQMLIFLLLSPMMVTPLNYAVSP